MDVEIFLCEEHYNKLRLSGPVKGSSRLEDTLGLCLASQCNEDIAWSVKVRLPEKKVKE